MGIRNKIKNKVTGLYEYIVVFYNAWKRAKKIHADNRKSIFFISTPIYENLGDYAIVYAQYKFFEDLGCKDDIIEFNRKEYERLKYVLKIIINPKDLIIIDGGGNIGTLWIEEEYKMRDIITRFPNNPIYIFPQTAYFSDDEKGKQELKNAIDVYNRHSNLTVFCRDAYTYNLFKKKFELVRSIYTPDMVLYVKDLKYDTSRDGILVCLRDDKEKISSNSVKDKICKCFEGMKCGIVETSTLESGVNRQNREKKLAKKWNEFANAKLVITDRLHGMLFCAITGTPCVSLDNASHKIKNGYQWIKALSYIKFCEDEEKLEEVLSNLKEELDKNHSYDWTSIEPFYAVMRNVIEDELGK